MADRNTEPSAWRSEDNSAQAARQALITQSPWLTPYLGLRARLSQVWLNRWTILLLLVLVRVLLAIADIEDKIDDARAEALSSCTAMENVGSTMASAPHYMAQGVNELTAHGVEKAINGLLSMISMSVTAAEEIIVFAINVWTQTYLCLITLAVTGALHVALSLIEDVTKFLNETIGDIGRGLHTAIDDFDGALNKAIDGFDKVFHAHVPKLDVGDSLDKLDHLQLPKGLDEGLQKLNKSIPNFDQVNNLTQTALRFPFEELKKVIKGATGNYTINRNLFPIPQKEKLHFCSEDNGINKFFDGLIDVEVTAKKIAISVLVLLAIGVIAPMTWWEIQRWKMMQQKAQYLDSNAYDAMDAVYVVSRPYSSMLGIETAKKVTDDTKRRTLIRWCIAYCTSGPALFVLSLGLAGVFSGLCHYLCLKAVTHEVPQLTQQVDAFAGKIMDTVDNVSFKWANETNGVILDMNKKVNHDVFGWVNTTTGALNHTLNVATDEMVHALNVTFGGTILYGPIMEVYNCLIGLKVKGIEKGLTWVSDHAHIDFPLLPNDIFTLAHAAKKADKGDASTNRAADFLANADEEGTSAIKKAVNKLVAKIEKHIVQELIISAVVVGIWVLVFLIGAGRTIWLIATPDKTRGEGGQRWPGWFGTRSASRSSSLREKLAPSGGGWSVSRGGRLGDKLNAAAGSLRSRFSKRSGEGDGAFNEKGAFAPTAKAVPPQPEEDVNPFMTPKLPELDRDPFRDPVPTRGMSVVEPTLPNLEDNSGSNFKGQNYTLQPRPMPAFPGAIANRETVGSVQGGAVAPVLSHPRASWRPEVVDGSADLRAKNMGRGDRLDSLGMFGPDRRY